MLTTGERRVWAAVFAAAYVKQLGDLADRQGFTLYGALPAAEADVPESSAAIAHRAIVQLRNWAEKESDDLAAAGRVAREACGEEEG